MESEINQVTSDGGGRVIEFRLLVVVKNNILP